MAYTFFDRNKGAMPMVLSSLAILDFAFESCGTTYHWPAAELSLIVLSFYLDMASE